MKNPATPKGILVTVAFLALYCAFAIWFGWMHRLWLMVAIGVLAGIACVAAANMLRWSRFLVYALSIVLAIAWLYPIYVSARVAYFSPLPWRTIIRSLIPGFVLLAVACFCSQMAHRHLGSSRVIAASAPGA
ncbi:MAG TPA: hypothetical protein VHN17_11990 [Steroidobacteraceae bacterium]|nr:hypothetical protein [Steroidobacteraceae bacterium]